MAHERTPTPISDLLHGAVVPGEPTDPERAQGIAARALEAEIAGLQEDRKLLADEPLDPAIHKATDETTRALLDAQAEQAERERGQGTPGTPE